MYMIKTNKPPMFANDYIVITNVLNNIYRLLPPLLSNLINLRILNALSNDVPLISNPVFAVITIPTIDPVATKKS